jgi:hypothetical protein
MPPDFRLPDDFPDLTIPDSLPRQSEEPQPLSRPTPSPWREGDRVLAPWEPNFLYTGRIARIEASQVLIEFDDGDSGWVAPDQIRALVLPAGHQVLSRRRMGLNFYPGKILEVRGDDVCVRFEDGHEDEWTRIGALRIPCQASGPGATPTRVASHLTFSNNLREGDRVWAPWQSAALYAGTVDRIEGKEVHIHFDDGDRGWVQSEQLVPLEIPVGLRVLGRWRMGGQFYPGTVTEVRGDRIHIQYDDGDREWTKPAALALPVQPFGPDARPTKAGTGGGNVLGWVIPILLGVLFVLARASCR